IRTVRLGYAIQFARRPPRFSGIHFTFVKVENAVTLRAEIATLLRKGAIEPVPPAEVKKGFYSPYFIVPKKGGGLRPILDLRVLNRALHRLPFNMLTQRRILASVRHQDWFAAVDLKDAYFHVSILPRHRPFLRFVFEGRAYQYKVLPFGLSLSPRVFTKIAEAALAPLKEVGIRILNYLDDWLILAHSTDLSFLQAGVPLELVSRRIVVTTDASKTGWGAVCNGHAATGLWTGPRLRWHINCLELLAILLALRRFRPLIQGNYVLVRTDSTAAVAYVNRQGGLRSRCMSQLARRLLLRSQQHLKSLRATHIPGNLNATADALSRQVPRRGEWRLHPQVVQLIWSRFGQAQVDLFASQESSHCPLWYALTEAPLGIDTLAHSWPPGIHKYAFPPVSLLTQTLCKVREDEEQVVLVAPYWPTQTWFSDLTLLATAPPWQIPLRKDLLSQGRGTLWHPRPDLWNLHVW
ncbi:uncharacterized protein LOC127412641, partial [Myxocyprinus asiaticus]|uniref:uncharacterized protein LOC127412641 n=1 Tax=Myxocyprinus asiaticus TaxID=70543 RepID=UPI00222341C1